MKSIFFAATLLLAFSLSAQAPVAVPIPQEPHHHLVLENEYVRVFRVHVPAHEATLLHQHDVPYLYVSLGPADVINAVQGKPETHLVMADGQLGYSPGHFAHIARNDSDLPFNNVTIELLKPQGKPENICEKIVDGPFNECGNSDPTSSFRVTALFNTAEVWAGSFRFSPPLNYSEPAPAPGELVIAYENSELQVDVPGKPLKTLRGGEVLWIDAGKLPTIVATEEHKATRFLLARFKENSVANKP
jgi:hypothetical protein